MQVQNRGGDTEVGQPSDGGADVPGKLAAAPGIGKAKRGPGNQSQQRGVGRLRGEFGTLLQVQKQQDRAGNQRQPQKPAGYAWSPLASRKRDGANESWSQKNLEQEHRTL